MDLFAVLRKMVWSPRANIVIDAAEIAYSAMENEIAEVHAALGGYDEDRTLAGRVSELLDENVRLNQKLEERSYSTENLRADNVRLHEENRDLRWKLNSTTDKLLKIVQAFPGAQNIRINDAGSERVAVIKELRRVSYMTLGLKEAKDASETHDWVTVFESPNFPADTVWEYADMVDENCDPAV